MNRTTEKPLLTVLLISGVLFLNPFDTKAQEGSPDHGLGDYNRADVNYTQGQQPTDGIGEPHNEVTVPSSEVSIAKPDGASAVDSKKKEIKTVIPKTSLVPKKEEVKEKTATSDSGTNNSEAVNNGENNESVLGFNVLYYIIQKFKFNDVNVIDQ
ncbi:hypothetical protein [Fulvivirga lutimaris]|uniref:hypothetical protein n=1 Tax=Fulvivirga lutimaris TaxID=1819566 RepID=UPI0012BC9E33|nr:hypothetical protein [Fulvivirga lutimaris]MTI39731.1 hypothetical protein [Fulvivirga lutimaris]